MPLQLRYRRVHRSAARLTDRRGLLLENTMSIGVDIWLAFDIALEQFSGPLVTDAESVAVLPLNR
jgi:hypothetical protein